MGNKAVSYEPLDYSGSVELPALPDNLEARQLKIRHRSEDFKLPKGLHCHELDLEGSAITELPDDLRVDFRLNLANCRHLKRLPANLKLVDLNLENCTALEALPENLSVNFLNISGTLIPSFPQTGSISLGKLTARDCPRLRGLPDWVTTLTQLDLTGSNAFEFLPKNLWVFEWLEMAGTIIKAMPDTAKVNILRWRGVQVDARIAFQPETITAEEIMKQENVEVRRVMLERMGYERFLKEAEAKLLDQDSDPGGIRSLYRIDWPEETRRGRWGESDEPVFLVSYFCPSTGRLYVTRVPPHMQTCHQAIAWMAGFEDPDQYKPIAEA